MQCERAQELWLSGWDDARPDAQVQKHVDGCADCRAFVAANARLDALLALDVDLPPSDGFDARMQARLGQARRTGGAADGQGPRMRRWVPLLVAAAAVALWMRVGVRVDGGGGPGAVPDPPSAGVDRGAAPPAPIVKGELPDAAPEDLELAEDLELLEALAVLEQLDTLEAYETLDEIDGDELEAIAQEEAL